MVAGILSGVITCLGPIALGLIVFLLTTTLFREPR